MSDFFERLAARAWGAAAVVQPLIAPRYAPPSASPEPLLSGAESQILSATTSPASNSPPTDSAAAGPMGTAQPAQPTSWPQQNEPTSNGSVASTNSRSSPAIRSPAAREQEDSIAAVDIDLPSTAAHSPVIASPASLLRSDVSQLLNITNPRESPVSVRAVPAAKRARSDTLAKPTSARAGVPGEATVLPSVPAVPDEAPQARLHQPASLPQARELAPWEADLSRLHAESRTPSMRPAPDTQRPVIAPLAPAESAVIQVTIGRLEVRAQLTAPTVRKAIPKSPAIGLDEYLNQHPRGRR